MSGQSMTVLAPRQPEAEKAALSDLLQTDGWHVFETAMRERWGPAQYEADVRQAMADAEPGEDITLIVGQINATYAAMRAILDWPRERIRTLSKVPPKKGALDPFAPFRRGMRP